MYLLPCRHVLALNLRLFHHPFMSLQVGKHWLRSHRPRPGQYPNIEDLHVREESTTAVPSSLNSTTVATSALNGQGRFGQLMGYCTNFCSLASEYHHRLYTPMHKHLMQLSYWAEGQVAAASSGVRTADPLPALPAGPSDLHPTVELQQVKMPARRKRKGNATRVARRVGEREQPAADCQPHRCNEPSFIDRHMIESRDDGRVITWLLSR
jgi:hypothetical protein